MPATRIALLILFLDLGGVWACFCVLLALLRRGAGLPPDAARAVTSDWSAAAQAPTVVPWPVTPAADPWPAPAVTRAAAEGFTPSLWPGVVDTAPPRPAWAADTTVVPRVEPGQRRRRLVVADLRNDPPAAAQPRYVELLLTRK